MKRLCLQIDLLLTLDCSPPLFVGFGIFHLNTCIGKRSWKSKGKGSKICVVIHIYVSTQCMGFESGKIFVKVVVLHLEFL